jgi:hypothetical protein
MDVWCNGILVYDMAQGTSWRTTNHFYNPDPFASDYNYQGINFQWTDGVFGVTLSALNKPAGDRVLYYHPMSSFNVSSQYFFKTLFNFYFLSGVLNPHLSPPQSDRMEHSISASKCLPIDRHERTSRTIFDN